MQGLRLESPKWVNDGFSALEQSLNGGCSKPLHEIRRNAFERLEESGFPSPKVEEWKYTNLSTLLKTPFVIGEDKSDFSSAELENVLNEVPAGPRLVFVNGYFQKSLSDLSALTQEGVEVKPFSLICKEEGKLSKIFNEKLGALADVSSSAVVALNTSFIREGVCVHVEEEVKVASPIEVVHYSTKEAQPYANHLRTLIVVEKGGELELNERFYGQEGAVYLSSSVIETSVAEDAKVVHHRLQCESLESFHVSHCEVRQAANSEYQSHVLTFGGRLVRNDINPVLLGENIDTVLNGLNVLSGEQHVDNHTVLDHAEPNCESNEWYKGIYGDKSKGNFSGTIIVRPDAQKTNAIQNNQSLLLSSDAESNAKPQLKIWADDVRCTHGATIGQLDEDALFYLRSRGIPKDAAYHVLLLAFAGDITEQIKNTALRERVEQLLLEKLG